MSWNVTHAQGELLAQVRPGVTTPVQLFKAGELRAEITLVIAAVIPGGGDTVAVELYHDDSGNDVYDNTTLIGTVTKTEVSDDWIFQAQHPGSGIQVKPNGSVGVRISTASAVNFSCYGITETRAERVRGI